MEDAVSYVNVNSARLAYRIVGPESAPLIITLHGGRGMGDHRSDFGAYSPLAASGRCRVLSFDYRGHGRSSHTKPYTFAQLVDDIEGIRRHFTPVDPDASKAIICGGSFGGFLALQYAITYPGSLSHLVLRGTAASYHHEEGAIATLEKRLHKAPSFSVSMLRDKVFGAFESDLEFRLVHLAMSPLYKEDFDPDVALRSCLANVYNAEAHNHLYSETEKYFDYQADLGKITAKTLVVVGGKDWICPPENSQLLAANIPDAELFMVEDANHSVHIEKNAQVLERMQSFLGLHG